MSDDAKSARVQIWIAIIGLVGVLAGAMIANWKQLFPPTPTPTPTPFAVNTPSPAPSKPSPTPTDSGPTIADAERLAANYISALPKRDTNSILQMISVPFSINKRLLLTKEDVRTAYETAFNRGFQPGNFPAVDSLKGQTVQDFSKLMAERGAGPDLDRVLKSLRIDDSDFVVVVTFKGANLAVLFFRHDGPSLSLAGTWG